METKDKKRRPRWTYLWNSIIVFAFQLFMLYGQNWDVITMYTFKTLPFVIVVLVWLHLVWGVSELIGYINYNAVDEKPKDESNDYDDYYGD